MNFDEENKNLENEDSLFDKNYFIIEYPGQDIFKKNSFKKWYSCKLEKIKIENEFQNNKNNEYEITEYFKGVDGFINPIKTFSFISVCKNCKCYSVHSLKTDSIFAKCFKCKKEYCVGCSIENYSNNENNDNVTCFRGYFKSLYLRMKFENNKNKQLEIMEYVFLFFITIIIMPIYLSMVSCFCYFNRHPIKPSEENNAEINFVFEIYKTFYPVVFALLYFVYIISFFPLLFILALIIFLIPLTRRKFIIIYEPIIR